MTVQFSRRLAIAAGLTLPIFETIRRWNQIGEIRAWPFWLDDWAIGAFLLYGAWQTRRDFTHGRGMLAAAWAFACGMGYSSFFSQLVAMGQADPSGVRSSIVVAIKGVMFALAVTALVATLRWRPSNSSYTRAIYTTDSERGQTFAEALRVHETLTRWYRRCEYEIIEVPTGTAAERCTYVLRALARAGATTEWSRRTT